MKVFLILLVLFSVFLVLLFLAACKVAGLADEQMERDSVSYTHLTLPTILLV